MLNYKCIDTLCGTFIHTESIAVNYGVSKVFISIDVDDFLHDYF